MGERIKSEGSLPEVEIFNKSAWISALHAISALNNAFFDWGENDPVLGEIIDGHDVIAYASWTDALCSDDSTAVLLVDPQYKRRIMGYTFAIPISRMDPRRADEATETAYIYATAIEKEQQGRGYVALLVDRLFRELARKGYMFAERDVMIDNGYADVIQRHYAGFISEQPFDHNRFGLGYERHFRIALRDYVAHLDESNVSHDQ
jgi:ribosomal protein S18 acetylase RimI-like enzyme